MQLTFGAEDAWNAMIFPQSHPSNASFMQTTIEAARHLFIDPANSFVQRAQQAFDHYNGSEALRFARRIIGGMHVTENAASIVQYKTLAEFQNATVLMQRWLMANPTVRQLYGQQRLDGYSDSYIDFEPGVRGWEHYDYRRVMNGLVIEQTDGSWQTEQFWDEPREGDRELILEEQMTIVHTWSAMEALLALAKDDPTSPGGGML